MWSLLLHTILHDHCVIFLQCVVVTEKKEYLSTFTVNLFFSFGEVVGLLQYILVSISPIKGVYCNYGDFLIRFQKWLPEAG